MFVFLENCRKGLVMADSNSQPPRCPCGFYGSAQTMGLCSKCYREQQPGAGNGSAITCAEQQQRNADAGSSTTSITESDHQARSPLSQTLTQIQTGQTTTSSQSMRSINTEDQSSTSGDSPSPIPSKPSAEENSNSQDSASTSSPLRGTKRKCDDGGDSDSMSLPGDQPPQKNRKRCFHCRCKMDLSLRAIGKCKCGYIFCQLHRLPEQHACTYDHKEKGREEARGKMVSPKKHLGTSLKRIDSDS